MNTIFIFMIRDLNNIIINRLKELLLNNIDAYVVCDKDMKNLELFNVQEDNIKKKIIYITNDELKINGWNNHTSFQLYSAWDKATYLSAILNADYIWFCEDDVWYQSKNNIHPVKYLLDITQNNDDDLIATQLYDNYYKKKDWFHWDKAKSLTDDMIKYKNVQDNDIYLKWMATYNQICRVSKRVIEYMKDLSINSKRLYFHESMFATVCNVNNYKIKFLKDINKFLSFNITWRLCDKKNEEGLYNDNQIKIIMKHNNIYFFFHPVKHNPKI